MFANYIKIFLLLIACNACGQTKKEAVMKYNELTDKEAYVILNKGTEAPYSGEYTNNKAAGTYICKQCNAPLYRATDKFESGCGWPSFDDEIEGAVIRVPDADGMRTEIICANCKGHLGHVFLNEGFTAKQTRHCVNSISMTFIPENEPLKPIIKMNEELKKAYFASGCFWGTEYYFRKLKGVVATAVGYMGGDVENPTYEQVCTKKTGHLETIEIEYNPAIISYDELVKYFFETHDFSQEDGQGPDIGPQYKSVIFYADAAQKEIDEKYIAELKEMGYHVATTLQPVAHFWKAEGYHQQYYEHKGTTPYCHIYKQIFDKK